LGNVALALLVPSRGRPQNIERLRDAMAGTCRGDTDLIVAVDDDDPTDYRSLDLTTLVTGPRLSLVGWLNVLANDAVKREYDAIGHFGDDNLPRTIGWDVRIEESLERNLFCFGNDLDPGRVPGSLSIHVFMRSEVIQKLGYMGPPAIQHMYVDPVWFAWGAATSIEYLGDVVLEHLHYTLGKSPADESYHRTTALIPEDCAAYNAYCRDGLNADIEKLGGEPFTGEALREFNHKLNIPDD
jgi:hypothetical protein